MMLFKRFYDTRLAQASYLIGCMDTHKAIVIDANRDLDQYVAAAAAEGVSITHVTETHIHADYVSGSRELAGRTGAALFLSGEGGPDWKYAFAAEAGAVLLEDGDTIRVGTVRLQAVHTPGHTPEHLTFLVTDTLTGDEPLGALTGDFLFVGDVGRPDLLERAAHVEGTMDAAAGALYHSLQAFRHFPDALQIWPGHGSGSACGKAIGRLPQSTLGYERRFNWAFTTAGEQAFVDRVLAGQPDPPRYFAEMKRVNREGPPTALSRFDSLVATGAIAIDTRSPEAYGEAHIPGTLNLPLNQGFTTWAGWLIPYTRDIVLIADEEDGGCGRTAARELAMIGLDRVAACFPPHLVETWTRAGRPAGRVPRIDAGAVASQLAAGAIEVIDVRSSAEWNAGHIAGARNIPLGYLQDRLETVGTERPVVVHCQGGARSAIAASLLQARTPAAVLNFAGGFGAWEQEGHPSERPAEAAAGTGH